MNTKKWLVFVIILTGIVGLWPQPGFAADEDPAEEAVEQIDHDEAPVPVSPDSKARMEIVEDTYDFGSLQEGETDLIEHTFEFKSVGEEPLLITKIKPSCGCTSAIASATELAPGEVGTLKAALKPKGKFGSQSITVRVETNDPKNPTHAFKITGSILSGWRVIPSIVDFRDLGKGETRERTVNILSQYFKDQKVYRITGVKTDHASIEASTSDYRIPTEPAKGKAFIEFQRPVQVKIAAGEEMGPQEGRVLVTTDDPKNPTQTIHVKWNVDGDLSVSMKRVVSTKIRGRNVPRPLTLLSRSGTPFEVLSIEIKDKDGSEGILELTPEAQNTPSQKTYQVTIKEAAEGRKQPYLGDIVVKVSHPEQKEVTIPYTASVRD